MNLITLVLFFVLATGYGVVMEHQYNLYAKAEPIACKYLNCDNK